MPGAHGNHKQRRCVPAHSGRRNTGGQPDGQECVRERAHPLSGSGRAEPSFVSDAPRATRRAYALPPRAGHGAGPPRLAEWADRDWQRPGPHPSARGGRYGCGGTARAALGGLVRSRARCAVFAVTPCPSGACGHQATPRTSGLSAGWGGGIGPLHPGPVGCAGADRLAPGNCDSARRGRAKRGGRARQGKEGVRKEAAAARRRVIYTFKTEPPAPRREDLGSVREHARDTSAPPSPARTAGHLSPSCASLFSETGGPRTLIVGVSLGDTGRGPLGALPSVPRPPFLC
ncbi:Collagen Alpha-5(Vi) Chain [Manis pentadactyla]|nr:Collagen Alpha-5(Vi) Chain [Manis pentadactyla]